MADVLTPPATTAATPQAICACGATERHGTDADRCIRGHVLNGNQARRVHGVRAFETKGDIPDPTRLSIEDWRDSIISDLGGRAQLSTVMLGYIRRLSELETTSRLLADHLARNGIFTPRGRVRSAYTQWLSTIDRWQKVAERIGVDRKLKPVSLSAYLQQASPTNAEVEQ